MKKLDSKIIKIQKMMGVRNLVMEASKKDVLVNKEENIFIYSNTEHEPTKKILVSLCSFENNNTTRTMANTSNSNTNDE